MTDDQDDMTADLFSRARRRDPPKANTSRPPDAYPNGPGHRGVDTSIHAAESVRAQAPFMQTRILSYLVDCAGHGAIYTDIMTRCRMTHPTVTARMVELVESGNVRISRRRRKTPSGRKARVYLHKDFWNPKVDDGEPE